VCVCVCVCCVYTNMPHAPPVTSSAFDGHFLIGYTSYGWLGSRVVSMLHSGAEGPGSNRSHDAVG